MLPIDQMYCPSCNRDVSFFATEEGEGTEKTTRYHCRECRAASATREPIRNPHGKEFADNTALNPTPKKWINRY